MENKKPQNTPAPTKTPAKAVAAKPKQPIPAKEEKPKANSSHATSSKTTKPAQASKTKANKPSSVKPAQPKPAIAPKVQTVAPKKVAQPTQKKPSVAVKANKESATQPSPKKPQSPIAKASANKVVAAKTPNVTKAEESAHSSKPKAIPEAKPASVPKAIPEAKPASVPKGAPEAKPASVPKGAPEAKPAPVQKALPEEKLAVKEQVKVPEQKTESKSAPAVVPSSKSSTLVKLATKGFVIQSWQIAVAVVVILVLVVGGVLLGTLLGNKNMDDPIVDYTGPLTNNNPDDPGNIALPGYPSLVFPANSKKVTLELPNPSGNPCYFQYTLTIAETDEVLYQSEPIEPGKMVKELTLNRALSQGTYTLRITIDTFSLADGTTPMNGGVQEVTVTVK